MGGRGVLKHQPVPALGVRLAGGRRLVSRPVPVTQQLTVELRQRPRVRGVQYYLLQFGESLFRHRITSGGSMPLPSDIRARHDFPAAYRSDGVSRVAWASR